MNSQALQKRIVDGKLINHGSVSEWPTNEFRSAYCHGTDEDLSVCEMEIHTQEYPASIIQGQRSRNWNIVSRLRH